MEYTRVDFFIQSGESFQQDLLIDALGSLGYDTFEETADGFAGYIVSHDFSEQALNECLNEYKDRLSFTYRVTSVPTENWNAIWESNFSPLIVKDECYVRATFHEPRPEFKYEIVIDPKMAFGTGHHHTTTMMMEYILENDPSGESVLDMGCGTGILAILAAKRGAAQVVAIDYDPLSFDSTVENSALNGEAEIIAVCGSKEAIPELVFRSIYANINRNILLDQIPAYAKVLAPGGNIYFSGFYETPDLRLIVDRCSEFGIQYVDHKNSGDWVSAHFSKPNT